MIYYHFLFKHQVTNNKQIEYREYETPYIRKVPKRYGRPGDLITLVGRLFTKEYGNANWRDEPGKFIDGLWI